MSMELGPDTTIQVRVVVKDENGNPVTNTNSFEISLQDLKDALEKITPTP